MPAEYADVLIAVFNNCAASENAHFTPALRGMEGKEALKATGLGKSSVQELSIDLSLANSFRFESLALCPNIQVLKISGFMGTQNMFYLAQGLKRNNVLRVLAVGLLACRNYEVLHSFADAVAVNNGLQALYIQDVTAIVDIAPNLARGILTNQSLQALVVQGYSPGAIDVKMLAVALIGKHSLNQSTIRGSKALNEWLEGLTDILFHTEVSRRLSLSFDSTYIPCLTRF